MYHARHRKPGHRGKVRLTVVALAVVNTALTVPLTTARPATADSTAPAWTQEQIDARYSAYRQRINQLLGEGMTQADIAQVIAAEFDIVSLRPVSSEASVGLPNIYLRQANNEGSGTTTSADILLYTPTFSYDNYLHHYVMAASWEWNQCPENYNQACWTKDGGVGNMGGADGMALKINRPVSRKGGGISTNDNCGNRAIDNGYADTDNGYGLGFIYQDVVSYSSSNGACAGTPLRYNWHRGTVSEIFDFDPDYASCTNYQIKVDAKIGHTWSSTSVDSIGISTSGISFSWSSSDHRWNAIPTTPVYGYC